MKKTVKVSLAGMAFSLEEDAYQTLNLYLDAIRAKLGAGKETDEILHDIEERTSELFSEMLKGSDTVNIEMVNSVMETLGKPEDIAGDTNEANSNATFESTSVGSTKRLYRDSENAVIAGVCSGLGAYFNVDPIVFRIIFIALFFATGLGLILYVVLWIAAPRALTSKQKLEMRGEPINLENIEKNIKKEYEAVKANLNSKQSKETVDKSISFFSKFFLAIIKVIGVFVKVIGIIIAIFLIIIGSLALVAVIGSVFFGGMALSVISERFGDISITELLTSTFDLGSIAWVSIPVFLIIAIPLVGLIFLGIRIIFNFQFRNALFSSTAALVWVGSIVVLAVTLFLQARSFTIREKVVETITISVPEGCKTLTVEALTKGDSTFTGPNKPINVDDYILGVSKTQYSIYGKPSITIGKATGDNYELVIEKKSRGATEASAIQSAMNLNYSYTLTDSVLKFNPYFSLEDGEKWRVQELQITLNVPVGKRIYIAKNLEEILSNNQEVCLCWPDELIGKTWVMRKERMVEY
jgi:phage shock protein PspC (stress-responsive transcriptional regulator)